MKKWLILMSTGLILTACGGTTAQQNEAPVETEETSEAGNDNSQSSSNGASSETTDSESSQSQEENTDSESSSTGETTEVSTNETQSAIDKATSQLNNGALDKAALTIRTLEEEQGDSLTENEVSQIEEIKQNIDSEKMTQAETNQPSEYQEVRQSSVMKEKFEETTGENLEDASDEEVETWLNEQDTSGSENTPQNNTEENNQNKNQDSSSNQPKTDEELKNYALNQVTEQTGLLSENYAYFVDLQEDNWVTVEIREEHSDGATEWTTMVGLYRYNVETDTLEKMDPVTGEFN